MAEQPTFWEDIFPLFTDGDVACMRGRGVLLASVDWWKGDHNCESAIRMLESKKMPLGGPPWDPVKIQMLKDWQKAGFPEGHRPSDQ
jgi:hypothetical protein